MLAKVIQNCESETLYFHKLGIKIMLISREKDIIPTGGIDLGCKEDCLSINQPSSALICLYFLLSISSFLPFLLHPFVLPAFLSYVCVFVVLLHKRKQPFNHEHL